MILIWKADIRIRPRSSRVLPFRGNKDKNTRVKNKATEFML